MSSVPLFKNRHGNVCVVKGNNMFNFNSGRFFTTDPEKIAILLKLAETRAQGVYIDPRESEIDPSAATPMEVLKKKHIAEYLAEQAKIRDLGQSAQPKLQNSVGSTASSVIMSNSLAEAVAQKAVEDALETPSEPAAASLKPSPLDTIRSQIKK